KSALIRSVESGTDDFSASARADQRRGPDTWPSGTGSAAALAGRSRLAIPSSRGHPGGHLHGPGDHLDRMSPGRPWDRGQRLVLPRYRRGPILAAIERPDPG